MFKKSEDMSSGYKILVVLGTRPEAIKMGPVVLALRAMKKLSVTVCSTGQHRDMVGSALSIFDLQADVELDCMVEGQDLTQLTAKIMCAVDNLIRENPPQLMLVHGDTATTIGSSMAAYFNKIAVGHVEAGLRTGNLFSPWPEEGNRALVSKVAGIHFAPTQKARWNLLQEGINEDAILVTGNTVIDALLHAKSLIDADHTLRKQLNQGFPTIEFDRKIVLITTHRRENFGDGLQSIIDSVKELAVNNPETQFVLPTHLNPKVKIPIDLALSEVDNVHLIAPQEYLSFVYLMMNARLILTDSGGIQEEAPSLGVPVVLMRDTTERPEAIDAGLVTMVGTEKSKIVDKVTELLNGREISNIASDFNSPYGNGDAARKIATWIIDSV